MPYKLRKAPKRDLYWVVGENGVKHSKDPIPRERAEAQMRALYSAMRKEGGVSIPKKEFIKEHKKLLNIFKHPTKKALKAEYADQSKELKRVMKGKGLLSNMWNIFSKATPKSIQNAIAKYANPIAKVASAITSIFVPQGYAPSVKKWLEVNGAGVIKGIRVRRVPVSAGINLAFQAITVGQWEQTKKKVGYDDLFHLALIIDYELNGEPKTALLEKLNVINLTNNLDNSPKDEYHTIPITTPITIIDALNKTQSLMGAKFFTYSAFKNNCQNFVYSFLQANNLLTSEASSFILQGVDQVLQEQPEYTEDVSQTITNLGGIANRLIEGYGKVIRRKLKARDGCRNKMVAMNID
jgi:hypothetical protein